MIQGIHSMPFEWNDLITPVVTVTVVWLGARLALSNEIRKKALELETMRLERLAVECGSCLSNLNRYCMRVYNILEDLSGEYSKRITLAEVTRCLKESAKAGTFIDIEAVRQFQNTLELHRQANFEEWKEIILPLVVHLDHVIASPSLAIVDCKEELSRQFWVPEQVKNYNKKLAVLAGPLPAFRQRLFARIAGDYQALLHPAPHNIWGLIGKAWRALRSFVRYHPSAPGTSKPR